MPNSKPPYAAQRPVGAGLSRHAALGAQDDAVAPGLQRAADQGLVGAKAVERGGVKQRHALVQRLQQQPLGGVGIGRLTIGMAEVHATQADGRDFE